MDTVKEDSKFSTLPLLVRLNILKKLTYDDRKIARLTCTDWFGLINFVQNFSFTITDDLIHYQLSDYTITPIVLSSPFYFYSRITRLKVMSSVKPIPIYSATRMDVPTADELALICGISEDNILKLLRYYASGCKSLIFENDCFRKVDNSSKMKIDAVLANITKFSFTIGDCWISKTNRQVLEEYNHTRALSEFLAATSMPNLKTFEVCMSFYDPEWIRTAAIQKFAKNFGIFIEKNGKAVSSIVISYGGHLCVEVFQHFSKLPNVISLTCDTYFSGVDHRELSPAIRAALWTPFATYKKLECFTFGCSNWDVADELQALDVEDIYSQFATMVLANNQDTLTTINNKHSQNDVHGPLAWLHEHSYRNLTSLEFAAYFASSRLFIDELSRRYKFPKLRELKVKRKVGFVGESDSGKAFIRWIVQVAPRLQYLTFSEGSYNQDESLLPLPLVHVRTLLLGLHQLKHFKLTNYWARATSEEVDDWLRNQTQIKYKNSRNDLLCDIFIKSQPFIETLML